MHVYLMVYKQHKKSLQAIASNTWCVPSISGIHASGYLVIKVKETCDECTDAKVCRRAECSFLCCHRYTCSCYDYNNGHVCKHIHRVHSLLLIGQTVQP